MICPHCAQSLLQKERPDRRCSICGRRFAFDPKTNPLRLNDLRVRRIADRLTQNGQLPCTTGQLWYALSRRTLRQPGVDLDWAFILLLAGAAAGGIGLAAGVGFAQFIGLLVLLVGAGFVAAHLMGVRRGRPKVGRQAFRTDTMAVWRDVYHQLPPGVLDDSRYPQPGEASADAPVVICPDRSIGVFLHKAGVDVFADWSGLPGRGPVLVLHDADPDGLLFVDRVRAAVPGRAVVDIGVPVDAVFGVTKAVPVRGDRPGRHVIESLAAGGELTPEQLKWLGKGWGFPLVGVPPAKLLAVVRGAVEDAEARRGAAAVGFLTWPEERGGRSA
ncbi:hypothetical protein ABZX85_24845 [Streptomyces sp. NPDC004539]|uniref:hypothetical protein n=1 Tax=Streptomyces sp. NPDC004539 TaxID=3154280 RepID=UPI0033B47F94